MYLERLIFFDNYSPDTGLGYSLGFLEPFTVLFGANSSGKTRTLEAVQSVFGTSELFGERRAVPGLSTRVSQVGLYLRFDLDNEAERSTHYYWLMEQCHRLNGTVVPRRRGPATIDVVARTLAGVKGPRREREAFARAVAKAGSWVIAADGMRWLDALELDADEVPEVVHAQPVPPPDGSEPRDWLSQLATNLLGDGDLDELRLEPGTNHPGQLADLARLGLRPMMVPLAPQPVHDLAQDLVLRALALLTEDKWDLDSAPAVLGNQAGLHFDFLSADDGPEYREWVGSDWFRTADDPWLALASGPGDHAKTFRVNPLVEDLTRVLSTRLGELCPSFVQELGRPEIMVTDPRSWRGAGARVEVVLRFPADDRLVSVDSLGAGARRWVAAALGLVGASLPTALVPNGPDERVDDQVAARRLSELSSALGAGLKGSLLLVDEPEAHLHPKAAASVTQWMLDLAPQVLGTLVATHSPEFLALDSALVNRVLVRSRGTFPHFTSLAGPLSETLGPYAEMLGLNPSDLLLLNRAILFVEGPHDVAVLEEWVGRQLRAAGVKVIPAHGLDNMKGLLESEVVEALGLRVGVLADRTVAEHLPHAPQNNQETAIARLVREAEARAKPVKVFGLSKADIVEYLPDDVCAEAALGFPGWQKALEAWRHSLGGADMKSFVTNRYHLRLDRSAVRRLAQKTAQGGQIPPEVLMRAKEIEAWAVA
jgi:hypothetical protein